MILVSAPRWTENVGRAKSALLVGNSRAISGRNSIAASDSLIGSFASGVTKDIAAVHAALVQPWSNGQITKLKLVKRQMYGRAKIDLLQARLIGAT
jgi:hypothetical protein